MKKIEGFIKFSKKSMAWCKSESEASSSSVLDVLHNLTENAHQVSSVSDAALQALKKIRSDTNAKDLIGENRGENVENLKNALIEIKGQHESISDTIDPIVCALQFQDRISQNLDNMGKMIDLWWTLRSEEVTDQEFGEKLMKATTMIEERKILRSCIDGLAEEEEASGSILF